MQQTLIKEIVSDEKSPGIPDELVFTAQQKGCLHGQSGTSRVRA